MPLSHLCGLDADGARRWPEWNETLQAYTVPDWEGGEGTGPDTPRSAHRRPDRGLPFRTVFVLHPHLDTEQWGLCPDLDRTALRLLLSSRERAEDPTGLTAALLARVAAPDTTVFAVLSELGQPVSLGNGQVLQALLHFWLYCHATASAQYDAAGSFIPADVPPALVPWSHGVTRVWWEGSLLRVSLWPAEQHDLLRWACAQLLLQLDRLPPGRGSHSAAYVRPPPPYPPCGGVHEYPTPIVEADHLCPHCLHRLAYESHVQVGPLSLDPGAFRLLSLTQPALAGPP